MQQTSQLNHQKKGERQGREASIIPSNMQAAVGPFFADSGPNVQFDRVFWSRLKTGFAPSFL